MALFEHEIVVRVVMDTSGVAAGAAKTSAQVQAMQNGINASAKKSGRAMQQVGLGMQNIGRTMTQFVTLPVVAGFAVATVAGYRYEKALLKVKNLTGLTAAQTQLYGEQIKKLAPAVGVGPQALAESFYFIASSGFKAKAAMELLTISAKATAAGMGDAQTTADVLTSAINAYGHENLTAARAADILMKTIQVGKAEPIALARSLGRIMPVAAQLGVSLSQVGGAIAGLTLTGLSSAEAVTALRGTMIALVAPAKMSIDELKRVGTSYQEITGIIRDKGLLPALEFLRQKTDGNMLSMRKIIPNVRALNGVLSLLGENYSKNVIVTQKVTDSQGKLNEAFAYTKTTAVFKMDQAIAAIKVAFTDLGQTILPTVARILGKLAGLFQWFDRLPSSVKNIALIGAAFIAIVGPITMATGSIIRSIALISTALGSGKLIAGLPSLGGFTGGTGLGVGLAGTLVAGLAVAVAAVVATEVTAGLDAGLKQAKANRAAKKGFFEDFWSTFLAVPKGMAAKATEVSNWLDELLGGAGAQRRIDALVTAQETLAKRMSNAWGTALDRLRYVKADLDKAVMLPAVDAALKIDSTKTRAELLKLRSVIMTELNITKREAGMILKLLFPADWGNNFKSKVKGVGAAVDKMRTDYAKLQSQLQKAIAFKDITGVVRIKASMKVIEDSFAGAVKKAHKASVTMGESGVIVATGLNRSGQKVKVSTGKLVSFIQLPLGKMGPKFLAMGGDAGNKLAEGLGRVKGVADKMAQMVNKAIRTGKTAAAGANVIGAALGTGAASGVIVTALNGTVAKMVANGIAAGMAAAGATSPSKKMMKLGMWMAEGLTIGLKKGQVKAVEAASSLATNVLAVFDATLSAGATINDLGTSNLPTAKYAKKWATKAANMMKAIIKAMQSAFSGIDIGKAVKGGKDSFGEKSAGWKAEAFGSVVSMAEGVGSIFTTFSELTTEKIDSAIAAITAVKAKAKTVARAIAGLVRSILEAFNKTVVSEFTASSATRILELATAIAGIITTFAVVTSAQIDDALVGLRALLAALAPGKDLANLIAGVAYMVEQAFADVVADPVVEAAANEAMGLASSIAGVVTTFASLTQKMIDDACAGLRLTMTALGPGNDLANLVAGVAYMVRDAFKGTTLDTPLDDAAKAALDLANNIAGVIVTFSTITKGTVDLAMVGITNVIASAPLLGLKLKEMVLALKTPLLEVAAMPDFTPTGEVATKVAAFVSDIASVIGSLAGLYTKSTDSEGVETVTDYVDLAITAAKNVAGRAGELGTELKAMVLALSNALIGGLDLAQLADLTPVLGKLAEIATAIKDIVIALSEMTAEKLASATDSGAALGAGFLAGLRSQYALIIAEAQRIVNDTNTILAGGTVNVASLAPATGRDRVGGNTTTSVSVSFSGDINAVTPQAAQQAGQNIAAAVIKTLAGAKRSTARGTA